MEGRKLAEAVLAGLAVTAMTFGLAACGGGGGNSAVRPGGGGIISPPSTSSPPTSSPPTSSPPTSSPPTSSPPTSSPPTSSPPTPYDPHNNQLIPTGALDAQKAGFTGAGVKVGVLDSGVDPADPALNASDATHRNKVAWFKSYDPGVTDPTAPNDNFGHGTVTAQLIAGDAYSNSADKVQFNGGVAPGADLYVSQACYGYGSGSGEACHPTAQVYNDLIAQGVKVISAAFSDSGDVTQYIGGAGNPVATSTYALMHPVAQAGVLQFFGTGESGKVANPGIDAGLPYLFPDMQPYIIAVTVVALDANGKPTGLYTDGNGTTPCGVAAQWCLAAPAEVYTVPASPAFATGHSVGTSSGTAIVTGVAAQVWQAFPWMTAANMSDTLLTTATPIPGCPASQCGWGMVNAAKAVNGPAQFAFGDFDANIPSGKVSTFANDIGGAGGLILSGPGTLVLSGTNTYTGGTNIADGTLQSATTLPGNVSITGGSLSGAPGIAGNLSNAGRVVVHGGDTAVAGTYTQTTGGALAVSLGSKLAVTGNATLDGALEIIGADSGYAANVHTDVLTAAGGISGKFVSLVKDSGVVFTSTTIQYGANDVYLDTTGLSVTVAAAGGAVHYTPASMGSAVRVQGAFEALDAKIEKGKLDTVSGDFVKSAGEFQQAPTLRAAQDSLESLSGQLYAASAGMTLQAIDATSRALSSRLEDLAAYRGPQHTWARQLDLSGDMARSGYGNVNYQINGWLAGTDMRLGPHALAGFALSQGNGFEQLAGRFDRNRSQSAEAMAYAGWTQGRWYANGRVGLGHYHQYMDRMLLLGTHYQGVGTDFAGRYNVAYGEGGLHFRLGTLQLTPFADLEYDRVLRDGFVEQGAGGFGLKADAQTISRSLGGAGFKLARAWRFDADHSLSVDAHVQWRRTLASSGTVFDASLVGMDEWRPLTGVGLSRNSRVFGLDLNANLSAHTRFALGGDYVDGDRGRAIAATANFTVAF